MANTQAMTGTALGAYSLQRRLGTGRMGSVFLATQSSPYRKVAVKVLLPVAAQAPEQHASFLARFQEEMGLIASLDHPNILPIYDYGTQTGFAHLVMPYMTGGTLQDLLKRGGMLAFAKAADYLDQLAEALDYAHSKGVIHRDVTPSNIFVAPDGHLQLADFGLMGIAFPKQPSQLRLLKSGLSVGSIEYMAPEQVTGGVLDARADLYALGIILYQMVTGSLPFQGGTHMEIAAQHVQAFPPSPRSLRPELPTAAEQVILRTLAKPAIERYALAKDVASAFRLALTSAGLLADSPSSETTHHRTGAIPASRPFAPRQRSLFDPIWQKGHDPATPGSKRSEAQESGQVTEHRAVAKPAGQELSPASQESGKVTGQLSEQVSAKNTNPGAGPISPLPPANITGSLLIPNGEQTANGTIKLTGALKLVQVPVAGQPGRYVTGLLPASPETAPAPETSKQEEPATTAHFFVKQIVPPLVARANTLTLYQKLMALALLVLLILFGSGSFIFLRPHSAPPLKRGVSAEQITPDVQAMRAAEATATASANIILSDPLSQNIHNWPVSQNGSQIYFFSGGAYHILDNDNRQSAPALLSGFILKEPLVYSLTMEEIMGNDLSINNSFGMILYFNSQYKGGRNIITFYSFEVVNTPGGKYEFWKYDNSQGPSANPWTSLWASYFGSEFHEGQGPHNTNTFTVVVNNKTFTFMVNGKNVGSVHDGSFTGGEIGMLVNLKGTEVAFSNLKLSYH